MTYTLSVWALWMVAAGLIGLVVGWLLGRLRRPSAAPPDLRDETPAGGLVARSEAPTLPSRAAEVERLRAKVAELEHLAIERDRLAWELSEARSAAHASAAPSAEAVFAPVAPADTTALAAVTAERDEWASKAVAFEQLVSELRVRVWNAEARVADLQALVDARPSSAPAGGASAAAGLAAGTAQRSMTPPPRPDLVVGEAVLGGPLRFDDLTVLEGVGPQIAQLCVARGIDSWWTMANTDVDRLRRMLAAAGPRFQVQDPSSWPEQARLLANGDWVGFRRLSHAFRGGRSVE